MLVKFGGIITEGRGSIGDVVYSRNRYGPYARENGFVAYTPSAHQSIRNTQWHDACVGWKSLTDAQRLSWRMAAEVYPRTNRFGDHSPLTGQAFYSQLNSRRHFMGQALLTLPPVLRPTVVYKSLSNLVVTNYYSCSLYTSPLVNNADYFYFLWATPSLSPGINNPCRAPRLIRIHACTGENPIAFFGDFSAYYGVQPTINTRIFVLLQSVHKASGLASPKHIISTIVTG